ncbi:MAG: hypothetical protein HOO96_33640 [Polyangiaceae bacterium]|nr:hypothetical protein [Polyangiaceae bacterium]
MRSTTPFLVTTFVVLLACGESSRPAASPSPARAGACALVVFVAPACQSALDASCCAIETDCGNDAARVTLLGCVNDCNARAGGQAADRCIDGCARQSHASYCQSACRGQGAECPATCASQSAPSEPLAKWGRLANCSKEVTYPPNCNGHR